MHVNAKETQDQKIQRNPSHQSCQKMPFHKEGDKLFTIEPLSYENFDETARILTKVFVEREVIVKILETTFDEFHVFVQAGKDQWIQQNLSWVVKNQEDQVVGLMINEDKNIEAMDSLPPKVDKIFEVFEKGHHLVDQSLIIQENNGVVGTQLHLLMLAVEDKYKGMNFGEKIMQYSIQNAIDKGYQEAFAECSSSGSAYLLENKFGFTTASKLSYKALLEELNSSQKTIDFATMMFRGKEPALTIQYLRLKK
eukprot:403349942